jgi:hypothetical protein
MVKHKDIILETGIWAVIAGVAFALTFQFNEPLQQYRYGAAGWPRVIIYSIVFFALIQAIWSLFQSRSKGIIMGEFEEQVSDLPSKARGIIVHVKHLATFAVPLLYLFLLPRMGFFILTPFFIAGYMMLLGERRMLHLVGTTILIYALTILIFVELLFVPLPVGNWPGFYDINSFFVSLIK